MIDYMLEIWWQIRQRPKNHNTPDYAWRAEQYIHWYYTGLDS